MDLERQGFETPVVGTASFAVDVDSNGNIAMGETLVAGYKRIAFNTINALCTETNCKKIFNLFANRLIGKDPDIDGAQLEDEKLTFTVKWVVE